MSRRKQRSMKRDVKPPMLPYGWRSYAENKGTNKRSECLKPPPPPLLPPPLPPPPQGRGNEGRKQRNLRGCEVETGREGRKWKK